MNNTRADFGDPVSIMLASDANRSALIEMELANLTKDIDEKSSKEFVFKSPVTVDKKRIFNKVAERAVSPIPEEEIGTERNEKIAST